MVSTRPAIVPALLHYRGLEYAKIKAMKGRMDYKDLVRKTRAVWGNL